MPFLFTESKAARRLSNTPNKLAHNIDKPLPFGTLFPAPDDTVEGFSERNVVLFQMAKLPFVLTLATGIDWTAVPWQGTIGSY